MTVERHVYPGPDELAAAVSSALVHQISTQQRASNTAIFQLCLTGGVIASKVHEHLGTDLANGPVDPERIELWWGDERFVSITSPQRNAEPALAMLTPAGLLPNRIHPMPTDDGVDLPHAVAAYARELGDTIFDVCMLGIGPDGHVASIFPDHPSFAAAESDDRVIGVTDAPKPPPERTSLTLPVLNLADQIWFIAAGAEKADAVAQAYARNRALPAGQAHGSSATRFWLDAEAASKLPAETPDQ